ncbi:unnamed protein product, partial [Urochloa humidicola]
PGRLNCSPAPSLRSLPGLFTRWRRKARHHHPCLPHRRPRLHLPFHSGGQRPTIGGQAGTSSDRRGPMSGRRGSRSMATGIDLIVLDSSVPPVADLDLGSGSFGDYSVHRVFLDLGGKHYIHPGGSPRQRVAPADRSTRVLD